MAIFNPEPQQINAPDWTNVTKPVSQPVADTSTGLTLDTLAKGLDTGVKIADTAIKEDIKNKAETGVDKLRDAYTASLVTMRNTQIASSGQSLLPDDGTPVPPGVQSGVDRVKQIGTAMAQNGSKINDTLYTGALNAQAKQLRAQYPGYRDYIDEQIKSVSGVDPANAFYKNLMEDINRNQENNKTQTNAVLTTLRDAAATGFHDTAGVAAADMYSLVNHGIKTPEQALAWYNSAQKLNFDRKARTDARTSRLEDDADAVTNATKDLSTSSAQTISHNWTTMTIGKDTDTAEGLFKFIQSNSGNQAVKDERSQAIGEQLKALRNQTFKQLMEQANEDGTVKKLGGDPVKAQAIINGQLATFDLAIQSVFNKDWGAAYSHMNFNKAIASDSTNILYNAPDETVRKYNRMVGAISNISPQFGQEFFKSSLLSTLPQGEKEFLKNTKMELLTQPDMPQGKLTSIQSSINNAKAAGVKSPKSYDDMIKSVDYLADPTLAPEQKINLAKAFFDPTANAGLLSDKNFNMDHYDPILKRNVPGKLSVFTRLTAPQIAGSIAELSKSDPSIGNNYRTMLTREFGEQLYSREIKDLSESNEGQTVNSTFKVKFTNDKGSSPHFEIVGMKGEPLSMTEAINRGAPVPSINRLNTGMAGLYTAYSGSGSTDATNDVMKAMMMYGYQAPEEGKAPFRGNIGEIVAGKHGPMASAIFTAIRENLKVGYQNQLKKEDKN